jgi:filamentous hemagglutinin family protein
MELKGSHPAILLALICLVLESPPAIAQLTLTPDTNPDRSLGSTIQPLSPQIDLITGGTRPQNGPNLFHSFQDFNISAGRGVYFDNPAGVQTILSRVTGTELSQILGTLGVLGSANLFLINPNGIIFGRNASLDLRGGSFYGSTANGIRFGELGDFSASQPQPPTPLLVIKPSAFFFTARERQGEIINQSRTTQTVLGTPSFGLQVADGQTLLLLGGKVTVDNGELNAWGGRIEIGAVAGTGVVGLDGRDRLLFPSQMPRADVVFTNQALIDTTLDNGGNIAVSANQIQVLGGSFLRTGIESSFGTATSQAGDLTLDATGLIQVGQSSGVGNRVGVNSLGKGGNLVIRAQSLEIFDGAQLVADTQGRGDVGNIVIEVSDRLSLKGTSSNGQFASGIINRVAQGAQGNGGNLQISTGNLEVLNGGQISASTRGIGNAGNIVITASDRVSFNGGSSNGRFPSAAFSDVQSTAQGNGGTVQITANVLEVTNGAQLTANTAGRGNAGNVVVRVRDRALFDTGVAFSNVQPGARGNGGTVQITAKILDVLNTSLSANTSSIGNAGRVEISVGDRATFQNSFVSSKVNPSGQGQGGDVQITATHINVLDGAQVFATTEGKGNAGNLIIQAHGQVLFNNGRALSRVDPGATGNGGDLRIMAHALEVINGSQLIASTGGIGNAGNVVIQVSDHTIFNQASAFSGVETSAQGNGGNLQITTHTLDLLNGAQLIAATQGQGTAGNILVQATQAITIRGTNPSTGLPSGLFTSTTGTGNAGTITLTTPAFRLTDGAILEARTLTAGNSGDIFLQANTIDLLRGGQINALTQGPGNAGGVILVANERISLTGTDPTFSIRAQQFPNLETFLTPNSGIFVRSQTSSQISSQTPLPTLGGAGNITLTTPNLKLNQGIINAESATGDGGNITLNVQELLLLRNGSRISATAGTAQQGGNGGNIRITSTKGFIVGVKSENSDITANAFTGKGGNVNITAQGIYGLQFRPQLTSLSDITASSTFGVNGVVTIDILGIDPSRGLVVLPTNLTDPTQQIGQTCGPINQQNNSFVITGRGGIPLSPEEPLEGRTISPGWIQLPEETKHPSAIEGQNTSQKSQQQEIVEATGWLQDANGKIHLIAEIPHGILPFPLFLPSCGE